MLRCFLYHKKARLTELIGRRKVGTSRRGLHPLFHDPVTLSHFWNSDTLVHVSVEPQTPGPQQLATTQGYGGDGTRSRGGVYSALPVDLRFPDPVSKKLNILRLELSQNYLAAAPCFT